MSMNMPPRRPSNRYSTTKMPDTDAGAQDETGKQQRPSRASDHQEQGTNPASGATRAHTNAGTSSSSASIGHGWANAFKHVYVRDPTKHPPAAGYSVGGIGILAGTIAILWQMNTTFSAFTNIIYTGTVWKHLSEASQSAARQPVNIAAALIAVSFQLGLLFWAFKVDKRWLAERQQQLSMAAKAATIGRVLKEIIAENILLTIWAALSFVADTIGDVNYINTISNDPTFLFFYATALYSLSTIGISESLQLVWDAVVTGEWLRYVKYMNRRATEEQRRAKQQGHATA